ncbi:MAG: hydrogenase maturation nickel metallochaperone HypA [Gammaproteobacteria bacterium]|nr:hydrogenase maturation nickel metallochaperone HypA [Gammaproteobacteria bacterium]
MHELAICQALIGQVSDVARSNRAAAVSDIFVSIGPLSGVEGPLMQNAFPIAAAGTVAGAAKLHLRSMPIRVHCEECGRESEAGMNRLVCEHCGDWRTRLISGDELLLQRVILENAAAGVEKNV